MVYTLGDSGKLPPLMMKAVYENSDARPQEYDFFGKISVHDFIYPPDTSKATSDIVVMDEVLRQDNPEITFLLNNSQMVTVCDNDVNFILFH